MAMAARAAPHGRRHGPASLRLLLVGGLAAAAGAERLLAGRRAAALAPSRAASAPAAEAPLGRRPLLAALLLGAAAGAGRPVVDIEDFFEGPITDRFHRLDRDSNQILSLQEFLTDSEDFLSGTATFSEADIDGDDVLSLAEFVFARYLDMEESNRAALLRMEPYLPAGFVQGIDRMFNELQKRIRAREEVTQEDVTRCLLYFFNKDLDNEAFVEESAIQLTGFFGAADVIPDGFLNLNELDFMRFMMVEALISAGLEAAKGQGKPAPPRPATLALFEKFDANKDGKLDRSEAVTAMELDLGQAIGDYDWPEEAKLDFLHDILLKAFIAGDADGDGLLDLEEAEVYIDHVQNAPRRTA